jgi:hypothetical protein
VDIDEVEAFVCEKHPDVLPEWDGYGFVCGSCNVENDPESRIVKEADDFKAEVRKHFMDCLEAALMRSNDDILKSLEIAITNYENERRTSE